MPDIIQSAGAVVPFWLPDSSTPTSGIASLTFSGAEIQISKPNGAWVNFAGSVTEAGGTGNGSGLYWLTLTSAETNLSLTGSAIGRLAIKINKSGAVPNRIVEYTVATVGAGDLTAATTAAIRDALLTYVHNGTHTIRGTLRRLEGLLSAKRAGLRGTGTAVIYQPDGVTPLISAAINETAGTVEAATIPSGTE